MPDIPGSTGTPEEQFQEALEKLKAKQVAWKAEHRDLLDKMNCGVCQEPVFEFREIPEWAKKAKAEEPSSVVVACTSCIAQSSMLSLLSQSQRVKRRTSEETEVAGSMSSLSYMRPLLVITPGASFFIRPFLKVDAEYPEEWFAIRADLEEKKIL